MKLIVRFSALFAMVLLVSGCAYNVGYNSSYLPPASLVGKVEQSALVVMTTEQEQWIYTGNPTSFTGSATTLTVPLGNITKQVALSVFSKHFKEVGFANNMESISAYRIVANPNVQHFEYAYNQLKNLGFAITPEVKLELHVTLFNAEEEKLLDKIYSSGKVEGDSYILTGSPEEKINQALHKTLYQLMNQAAEDAVVLIKN